MQLEDVCEAHCSYTAREKLKHFVSKEALNVEGLGKKVIDQFWDLRIIQEPSDIFNLDYEKIESLMVGDLYLVPT